MERTNSRSLLDCSRRRKHCGYSVGGICDLQDSILGHILSFLPTKNAVATCILSQRWKFLWTTISNLYFDFYHYDGVDQFVESVNYVLLLHKPGFLNEFTLDWGFGCRLFYVNAWISTVIARNVRKLSVDVGISKVSIHVQRSMFSCESLQSLKLNVNDAFCISQEIVFSLPKLESLELVSVIFQSEETLCKLLGGCPVLKYLSVGINMVKTKENCRLDNGTVFRCIIASASLRRLELFADDEEDMSICGVQLDAPSLKYIKLEQISSISVRQSPISLVEANIQLVEPEIEDQDHYNSLVEAFRAFDCAQKLVLNYEVIKAFKSARIEMKPMFNKLTRLEVTKDFIKWGSLHHFLLLLDNLEVLIVRKDCDGVEVDLSATAIEPNHVPRCLSNSLKLVAIGGYEGDEDEFAMISYILKHAIVLQLMEISLLVYDPEKKCETIQNICRLPRKSHVCEVEFVRNGCRLHERLDRHMGLRLSL